MIFIYSALTAPEQRFNPQRAFFLSEAVSKCLHMGFVGHGAEAKMVDRGASKRLLRL